MERPVDSMSYSASNFWRFCEKWRFREFEVRFELILGQQEKPCFTNGQLQKFNILTAGEPLFLLRLYCQR